MIPCEHCEGLINARLDGELSSQDALLLEEHLAQCPDCQKLDRDLTTLHTRLNALSAEPPKDFAAAILSQLEVPPMQPESKKKKRPWAVVACAAAAVVLMAVVLTPQMSPFGSAESDTAAAEPAEAPEAADIVGDASPAQGAETAQRESQTAEEEKAQTVAPLSEKDAMDLLEDYLNETGLSLSVETGNLAADGSCWTFMARSKDTGERFLYTVYCIDGFVEEVLLP